MSWWHTQCGQDGKRYVISSEIAHVLLGIVPLLFALLGLLLPLLGWLLR
jgi:hypothetical protein